MPTPTNAINEATTGICGFTGTAFVGTPVTQYNVLTGAATSSALNNVAPSATSGVPVISQGASAQPIFGTAVVAGGGTGQVTLTNHGVLVGAATAAITQLAAGTAGQVLQSGGASADPAYSTATYPASSGGTGKILYDNGTNFVESTPTFPASASATTRKIIVSDGTNWVASTETWAVPGSSGNILTSDGTNWTSAANSSVFAPNATVNIFDDFIGTVQNNTGNMISQFGWQVNTNLSFENPATADNGHPGIIGNNQFMATNDAQYIIMSSFLTGISIGLGGGAITLNWVFKIVNLSNSTNRYVFNIGLGDTTGNFADQANGCYVKYSDNVNSGNWEFVTASSSTRTTSTSSTAVTTGWHNLQITINAGATSVSFSMDGVSLGTAITTHIPTAVSPIFNAQYVAGTVAVNSFLIDLFYMTQTLTTAR